MHELAHLWVCLILRIRVYKITAGIFGMHLETENYFGTAKKIAVSAAGPVASITAFIIFSFLGMQFSLNSVILRFSFFNLCIGMVNLIPVSPLDGGTISKAVLSGIFGIIRGGRVQKKISLFFIYILTITYAYVTYKGFFSFTLLLVIIFLITATVRENKLFMLEKKHVLSGAVNPGDKIRFVRINEKENLLKVAGRITYGYFIIATVFSNGYFIGELTQTQIIFHIKNSGGLISAGECLEKLKIK